jgi:hypothetical protein
VRRESHAPFCERLAAKFRRPTHQLVGDFKNAGRELRRQGDPEKVRVYDFKIPELGKVAPYGVYDIAANDGWVSVGIDADTGAFSVESIRRWWQKLGQARYPDATRLVITADCGGSNGARVKLWKRELQRFANETPGHRAGNAGDKHHARRIPWRMELHHIA